MKTPFGEIVILIDGKEMPYTVVEREKDNSFKDVLGCYIISVPFRPDGKEHEIRCVIPDIQAEEIDHDRDVQTRLAADFTYRNSQW